MLKKLYQHFLKNKRIFLEKRQNRLLFLLILAGVICWSLVMVRSGLKYLFGYGFWGANGHDGIWHIALAESLSKKTLNNPVFAGEVLKNYHLGFDLLLSLVHRLFGIKISILYFQIFPVIFSLLIGFLVYKFVLLWRGSKSQAFWSSLFVYFGSGFGFVVTLLRDGQVTGESMFWSQQSLSTLVNPPFALSLIFAVSGLISFIGYLKKPLLHYFFTCVVFFGLLVQIKIYAGVLILGGLFVSGIYSFFKNHKFNTLLVFLGSLVLSVLVYLPFNKLSASVLVWQPFWFLETMMSYSDRLGWERFYSAMTTYKMGRIWFKEILAYTAAFGIFLAGNMGTRIIGFDFFIKVFRKQEKLNELLILIFTILFGAVLMPMLFVQKGTPWNTIQFFYYFLFFTSILAGVSTEWLVTKIKPVWKNVLIFTVFISVILGAWSTLQHYIPQMPQAKISTEEINALEFLERQPFGIVLVYPHDANKAKDAQSDPPRPVYLYESTAYVSAYTKKTVFLEDEVNANITGYDWKTRREEILWFVSNLDPAKGKEFLKSNKIKYLYLAKELSPLQGELLRLGETQLGLTKIFENSVSVVYLVE